MTPRAAPDSERRAVPERGRDDGCDRGPGDGSGRSEVTSTILAYGPDTADADAPVRVPRGQDRRAFATMRR
ncbi:hypothetical protein GCM10009726_16840 [Nocardioides furvisabuli]|uniref:Uncharacterized protein n=1 Tax=Nocardioides furvisabuli TaxID=375542 RepID=A0ABP5ITM0_9ACTN